MKILLFTVLTIAVVSLQAAHAQSASAAITIEGEVVRRLQLSREAISKMKQTEVKAKDKEGKEHTYKGIPLVNFLDSAGTALGAQLRGDHLKKYVLIKAADGYQVVFSLAEIDPEFTNQIILLAHSVDGKSLPKEEGPFRLIVPNDKRPTRWVRALTTIKVLSSKD